MTDDKTSPQLFDPRIHIQDAEINTRKKIYATEQNREEKQSSFELLKARMTKSS